MSVLLQVACQLQYITLRHRKVVLKINKQVQDTIYISDNDLSKSPKIVTGNILGGSNLKASQLLENLPTISVRPFRTTLLL